VAGIFPHFPTFVAKAIVMPYVNIKVTDDGVTKEQKEALIKGVSDLLQTVLNKDPSRIVVVIDEVNTDNWGIGGTSVTEFRKKK
jgi:4-oxalocrotonate tautomerase